MRYKEIKGLGKKVSQIVQGTIMLHPDKQTDADTLLDDVFSLGVNCFDSAWVYEDGNCERALGNWLQARGNREDVVVLTKCAHPNSERRMNRPYDIYSQFEDSLIRLKTTYVDIYLFHRDDMAMPVGPIETIYRGGNRHSHFHTLRDSIRVYAGFVRYGTSSLASAALDLSLFAVLVALLGSGGVAITAATVGARVLSGGFNFLLGRNWVFRSHGNAAEEAGKYLLLFLCQMAASALLVNFASLLLPAVTAKIIVDATLFFASYPIQSRFIFKRRERAARSTKEAIDR